MRRLSIVMVVLSVVVLTGCDSSEPDEVDLPPGVFEVTIVDENNATRTFQGRVSFEEGGRNFRSFDVHMIWQDETIRLGWVGDRPASGSYPAHSSAGSDGSASLSYSIQVIPDSPFPPYTIKYDPEGDNAGFIEVYTSEPGRFTGVFDAILRDLSDSSARPIQVRGRFHAVPG